MSVKDILGSDISTPKINAYQAQEYTNKLLFEVRNKNLRDRLFGEKQNETCTFYQQNTSKSSLNERVAPSSKAEFDT